MEKNVINDDSSIFSLKKIHLQVDQKKLLLKEYFTQYNIIICIIKINM